MKYYTAKEACDTFSHLMPDCPVVLRRWVKVGKFPPHDRMIKKGSGEFQAWSEYTILNWQVLAKSTKVTKCAPAFAEGAVPDHKVRSKKKGAVSD